MQRLTAGQDDACRKNDRHGAFWDHPDGYIGKRPGNIQVRDIACHDAYQATMAITQRLLSSRLGSAGLSAGKHLVGKWSSHALICSVNCQNVFLVKERSRTLSHVCKLNAMQAHKTILNTTNFHAS